MAEQTKAKPPVLPWKTRFEVAAHTFAVDFSCRADGTVNRRLMSFLDPVTPPSAKPINGVVTSDVTVDPSRNLWFRLFTPTAADDNTKLPVIVFFHGGGFVFFSPKTKPFDGFCRRLAAAIPALVVSVNYRLAPEHKHPSQVEDGYDTLKFLDEADSILLKNADLSRCFIAGDSAGGNIAHNLTLRASLEPNFNKLKILGSIPIQAFFGGEERTESELRLTDVPFVSISRSDWMWKAFLPEGADRNHEAVNVFSKDISVVNFPATLVFIGGFDPLQDWQRRYAKYLKDSGVEVKVVEYPNAIHAFYGFPQLPEGALLIGEVKDFIEKQSGGRR